MKREIKVKNFLIIIAILVLIEGGLIIGKQIRLNAEAKNNCKKAVCNQSNTICYTYDLDEDGNTMIKWRGSCAKE